MGLESKKVDLGQITGREITADTLLVKNLGEEPIYILFGDYRSYMNWKAEPDTLQPGEFGKLILSFDAQAAGRFGYKRDHVPLKVQDNGVEVSSVLAVESVIVEDYSTLSKLDLNLAPHCKILKHIYSLGEVKAGSVEHVEIEFKNEGKRELLTRHVESSREIKVLDYDARVAPGKYGKITLKVTLPKTKYYRKSVKIYNNDPSSTIQSITIMGNMVE